MLDQDVTELLFDVRSLRRKPRYTFDRLDREMIAVEPVARLAVLLTVTTKVKTWPKDTPATGESTRLET